MACLRLPSRSVIWRTPCTFDCTNCQLSLAHESFACYNLIAPACEPNGFLSNPQLSTPCMLQAGKQQFQNSVSPAGTPAASLASSANPSMGSEGLKPPLTTAGMVGYPWVSRKGRAGVPAGQVRVIRMNRPHQVRVVDMSLVRGEMRRCSWPEVEQGPAEAARQSAEAAVQPAEAGVQPAGELSEVAPATQPASAPAPAVEPLQQQREATPCENPSRKRKLDAGSDQYTVPGGDTPCVPSESPRTRGGASLAPAAQQASPAAAAEPERRPAKQQRWSQLAAPAAERMLPGFDGARNQRKLNREAAACPERTLLLINAHCLDAPLSDAFAAWCADAACISLHEVTLSSA